MTIIKNPLISEAASYACAGAHPLCLQTTDLPDPRNKPLKSQQKGDVYQKGASTQRKPAANMDAHASSDALLAKITEHMIIALLSAIPVPRSLKCIFFLQSTAK